MDIVDIVLSKALTPAQLATYMSQAQYAASVASSAAENIESITAQTIANSEAAAAALEDTIGAADSEIDKITLSKTNDVSNTNVVSTTLIATFPSTNTEQLQNLVKYYTSTGQNTDGTMTQKAITDKFDTVDSSISTLEDEVDELKRSGGGGTTNLGAHNKGKMVVVGQDGNIISSAITEQALIEALIKSGDYDAQNAVGLQIDYENRSFLRVQESAEYNAGADFNQYSMYGGRMRCNVADNGQITAWYGDSAYKEDGTNGQVMIYQPKFYYSRVPMKTENISNGVVIRKETIIISPTAQTGFKLHPLFKRPDGTELNYVLISAYEGSAESDDNDSSSINFNTTKLSSVAGVKPISGVNKQFNLANAEKMAQNRGANWHITNMAVESAQQMLQLVEYGTLNGQEALENGISYITNNTTKNCASLTGSTSNLGNTTGAAATTRNETNGTYTDYSEAGKRAISYRGFENPWGNIWRMIAGVNIVGGGAQGGGIPYICDNFNYSTSSDATNYTSIGFRLPSVYDWVSGFGQPAAAYDWVFMPIECVSANSALPIGDNLWTTANLNRVNMACIGGQWYFELNNGMFYYGCDQAAGTAARSFSARLMYIPEKDSIYNANIASWENQYNTPVNA